MSEKHTKTGGAKQELPQSNQSPDQEDSNSEGSFLKEGDVNNTQSDDWEAALQDVRAIMSGELVMGGKPPKLLTLEEWEALGLPRVRTFVTFTPRPNVSKQPPNG